MVQLIITLRGQSACTVLRLRWCHAGKAKPPYNEHVIPGRNYRFNRRVCCAAMAVAVAVLSCVSVFNLNDPSVPPTYETGENGFIINPTAHVEVFKSLSHSPRT